MVISLPSQEAIPDPETLNLGNSQKLDCSPLEWGMPTVSMQFDPYMLSWLPPSLTVGSSMSEAQPFQLDGLAIGNTLLSEVGLDMGVADSIRRMHGSKRTTSPLAQTASRQSWHDLSKADSQSLVQMGNSQCDGSWSKKNQHALNEQKYRDNVNAKIWQLWEALRSRSRFVQSDARGSGTSVEKISKVVVLENAAAYINEAEVNLRHMEKEKLCLEARIQELEDLLQPGT